VLVRNAANIAFAFESVQTVKGGFVGENLASELDFSDEGGAAVLLEISFDELQDRLLLMG